MKFFLLRTGSALVISTLAGLLMVGALALSPLPTGEAAIAASLSRPAT